jgi:energy-coupling factor transport system substrate-specific component
LPRRAFGIWVGLAAIHQRVLNGRVGKAAAASRSASQAMPQFAAAVAVSAALAAAAWAVLRPDDAALPLLLVAAALIVAGAAWLESGPGSSKELALIATLAAAASAGRVLFAAIPNVQPVTVTAVVAGVALGPRAGASTGALAALVSNLYLGQGAYTPWQMLAWGGCGLAGGLGARLLRRRIPLALFCFVLGFGFDAVMDVWEWLSFYPHTWQAFTALYARGIWFDAAHATGNLILALVVGPELRRLLERYARRLRAEVVWA